MIAGRYDHPMAQPLTLSSLPLFPLGTVLFPGGLLPLRIFEVRYLDMVRKCHKAGVPFGVVTLSRGQEVQQPDTAEEFSRTGTLATIAECSSPQPGLMLIRCHGTRRFRTTSAPQRRYGLWTADIEYLDDDVAVPIPEHLKTTAQALARLVESLQQRGVSTEQLPLQEPMHWDDCGWVANRWAELLPLAAPVKLNLMALDSPLLRLELISDLLVRNQIGAPDAP